LALARRERDVPGRGPTLGDRREEVDVFLKRVGVADRDSRPIEGLRGDALEWTIVAAGAKDDVDELL
jgi:hypothetical protein